MYTTSRSRDELIKSALDAIQDLDFIFKRSTDNPFEKHTKHLLPVVSRPLDHIREVAMVLDNQFMQQFNSNEHFGHSTSHPNTATPFPNFFTPPPNMFNPNYNPNMPNMHMTPPHTGIHNTFALYGHMLPPPPEFNVGCPYSQMFYSTTHNDSNPFQNSLELKAILAVIELLKDDPKATDVVSVLVEQLFPNQERRLNLSLQLLFNSIQKKDRVYFSEEELKEILQAIKTNIECWLLVVNSKAFQPRPKLELEDLKAIDEACNANMSVTSEYKGALKKLILISAKSRALEYEKRTLNELVLQSLLSGTPRPLMELKEIAKQVIANWSKESDPSHKPINVKEAPVVHTSILFNNIENLRSVIAGIDIVFNGEQNDDGGPKPTTIEHANHVNKLLKSVNHWATSEMGTKFDPRTLVVQCPANWPKVQIHVNNELHRLLTNHLESVCNPNRVSHLTPSDWERIEKAAENIDLMKKHKYDLRFILLKAIDKDFIGNNQDINSQRIYAFHRLLNNFVFFFGNDEENFMLIKSLVLKD